MSRIEEQKLNRVLNLFSDKIEGYKPKEYRSYTAMKKLKGSYSIQLMFGYNKSKNPIYSKDVEFEDFDMFIEVQRILNNGSKPKVVSKNIFDDLDTNEEQDKESW